MDNRDQYLQMFFDESAEYLQQLNENVLLLEENPEDEEIINAVFRAAHSVKGMSATMGYDRLTDLTHRIENILAKVRNKELLINEYIIDTLFSGLDYIKLLLDDIRANGEEVTDVSDYLYKLEEILENGGVIQETEEIEMEVETGQQDFTGMLPLTEEEKEDIYNKMTSDDKIFNIKVMLAEDCLLKNVRGYMILKKAQEMGYLAKSNPDQRKIEDEDFGNAIYIKLVSSLREKQIKQELADIIDVDEVIIHTEKKEVEVVKEVEKEEKKILVDNSKKQREGLSNIQVSPTVRVDIKKLDNLMNMVGELLINKTRLEGLNIQSDVYQDIIQQLDRVTQDLHHIVMQIRMVPIGGIFNRFPRMVRDLSKELDKEIDLIIEGADTELDRSLIDELGDPLMHILRNSIDHGIERPEIRKQKGKSPEGTILLRAYQKGSEIIIEVEDDGAGIDTDVIVEKAIERGIVTPDEARQMEERDRLNLIFQPGFSTSEQVTDISGRGVGMDVVRSVVEALDGQVYLESELDVGTRFTISLPLTLAITQALMVVINDEVYAIPLGSISETLLISPDEIMQVRGQEVILLRENTIPLVEASRQLNLPVEYGRYRENEEIPVVIIKSAERQIGLIVDELLNQQEIVISGATIVGDGDVALILDVRNIA